MAQKTKRLALVFGNSNYVNLTQIPNAVKDANAIQKALHTLGFDATLGINKEKREMLEYFAQIRDSWQNEASEIVVYYSGHGNSINGKVYLCPVDAINTYFIDDYYLCVDVILEFLLTYRNDDKIPIIIILDCCRSGFDTSNTRSHNQGDPLRGVREKNDKKKNNIAILYSTSEGHDALDGNNGSNNSPYTKILLENILRDRTIDEIQYELVKYFGNSSEFCGKQVPWIYQCLYRPYKFLARSAIISQELSVAPLTVNYSIKKNFHGVPNRNDNFIDRPKILGKIEAALGEKGKSNILALNGLSGMGKTQLMLHYCYLRRPEYEFIFWLEVDGLVAAIDSFLKLAINLGLDENNAKEKCKNEKIIEWVCDQLEKKEGWLLLLNNVDNTMITKLFKVLPRTGGNIILTTREHTPSNKVKVVTIDKMDEDEALSLLFGTSVMKSINPESSCYCNAKEIIIELGCMALAVDLVRAYVVSMSISFKNYLNMFKDQRDISFSHKDEENSNQYNRSLKIVCQLSLNRIRSLSPLAVELLDACAFLQSELIPVSLFTRQYSIFASLQHLSSSTSSGECSKSIQEAIGMLVGFSFVTRTLNEDINDMEDPARDTLTIHRLVQIVICHEKNEEQKIEWIHSITSALYSEIYFSDPYSSLTRAKMNAYLSHIRYFVRMLDIRKKAFMSEDLFELLLRAVYYLLDNGIYFGVEELSRFTLLISESIHEPESDSMARSLDCLANLYHKQGDYTKAEPLYQQALVIKEKVLGLNHLSTATSLNNLAGLYFNQGNYTKAKPLYERALVIFEIALGPEHLDTATSLDNLAALYFNQGNYCKAEMLYRRALMIRVKALGPDHPDMATCLNNLAVLYENQGNCDKAEPLYERALVIIEKALGSEHPSTATSLNNLAGLYKNQENYSKAEPLYERVLAIRKKALGPEHPETVTSLNNLVALYFNQGNYCKAVTVCLTSHHLLNHDPLKHTRLLWY